MSWQLSLILAILVCVAVLWAICAIAKWHNKRFLRIPYSQINALRITPRFDVGTDVK